jgi:hypothetical protein
MRMAQQDIPRTEPGQQPPTGQYPQQPQQQPQPQPKPAQQPYPQQQYPQQAQPQQQYPQQAQPAAQPQQQPQPQPPSLHPDHKKAIIVIAIIFLSFVGVGVYYMLQPEENISFEPTVIEPPQEQEAALTAPTPEPTPAPEPETLELTIDKFVFAHRIDDDFTYIENLDKTFLMEFPIFIYMEPAGFEKVEQGDLYKVDLVQDIEVRGPDGNIVPYMSQQGIVRVNESESEDIALSNELSAAADSKSGIYTVRITLKDMMSGKQATETGTFHLEPPLVAEISPSNTTQ